MLALGACAACSSGEEANAGTPPPAYNGNGEGSMAAPAGSEPGGTAPSNPPPGNTAGSGLGSDGMLGSELAPGQGTGSEVGGGTTPGVVEPPVGTATPDAGAPPPPQQLPNDITIWLAGDSTVANGPTPCPRGWGRDLAALFDARVTVRNSAVGGRSVHTWLYDVQAVLDNATRECALGRQPNGALTLQARWQEMLDGMKAGDYLLIQFGINDGDGACPRHVGLDAFEAAYGMMADAAKARGAQPVFITPLSSIACNGNTARGTRGAFVPRTFEAGVASDVPVLDLHAASVALYTQRRFCPLPGNVDVSAATTGPVGDFFCDDHTHLSTQGAPEIAKVVVQLIRDSGLPLAGYLK